MNSWTHKAPKIHVKTYLILKFHLFNDDFLLINLFFILDKFFYKNISISFSSTILQPNGIFFK